MTIRGAEKMNNDTVGVDVSKDHLDAHRLADGASRRFANDRGGHKAFVKWFAQTPVQRVVFEPTGPYHRAFERGGRSLRQGQSPSGPSLRRGDRKAGEDRSPGCGDTGAHGRHVRV
jgi:hypothetical protein